MGFLKFLSRDKKREMNDLDLPPEPPPLEGLEEPMPDMDSHIDMPDFDSMDKPEMPPFPEDEDSGGTKQDADMPDFDNLDSADSSSSGLDSQGSDDGIEDISFDEPDAGKQEQEQQAQPISQPMQPRPSLFRSQPMKNDWQERDYHKSTQQTERLTRQVYRKGTSVYVKTDKFAHVLGSISTVRGDLRKSDEALEKLENLNSSKDKHFDKLKGSFEDMQKKLIFVDKILFKGG